MSKIRAAGFDGIPMALEQPVTGKYYVLMIAIDYYSESKFESLDNPVRDANSILKVLLERYRIETPLNASDLRETDKGRYGKYPEPIPVFDEGEVFCLYNGAASRSAIIAKIDDIIEKIDKDQKVAAQNNTVLEDAAVLVYFAGHGMTVKQKFHLVVADSKEKERGTYLTIDDLTLSFKNYPQENKCRNVLFVLDSCQSGASAFGKVDTKPGEFSRHFLASCRPSQKADDGITGKGSPFAKAFAKLLSDNTQPYLACEGTSFEKLKDFFDLDPYKTYDDQNLVFGNIPGDENGQGFFIFELRDKNKPPVKEITKTLVNHLDFLHQRGDVEDNYKTSKNNLNIITTQGYSFDIQKLLSKIVFSYVFETKKTPFSPGACFLAPPVKLDAMIDDSIWKSLSNQIPDLGSEDPAKILGWFFEKLESDESSLAGKRHVILWIGFSVGSKMVFERIDEFCKEISDLFFEKWGSLTPDQQSNSGKLFIVLSDERNVNSGFSKEAFIKTSSKEKFNLIVTRPAGNINNNHIETWLKVAQKIGSAKMQALTVGQFSPTEGLEEYECSLEDLIKKLAAHCEYTEPEKTELINQLYDFHHSLF